MVRTEVPASGRRKRTRRKYKNGTDEMLKVADGLGYAVSRTKKGHFRFDKPGSAPVFAPGTPSDFRSQKNTIALLRRAA